ncbi:MAG: hypothetical protein A2289_03020 [Deltaproteobacteria bacterium RIFOXYA12_FULL_58_15]|nr:MAG: hypothetical protein A2289_03020 [Deltaproteobacteria bacterium RIFOXYA12_FULL_58_15]
MTELAVWVGNRRVGTLHYADYAHTFRYDTPAALDPHLDLVSLTMPVRMKSYDTQVLPPPFQSVLPEGDLLLRLRFRYGKALDLDTDVNLLRLVGHNTIGRLTFRDVDDAEPVEGAGPEAKQDRRHKELPLDSILRHPDAAELLSELIDIYGIRSGVGGVHPKVLLEGHGRQLTLTSEDLILKAAGAQYPHLPVNEFFCMQASRASGIPTTTCHLSDRRDLLVLERFDRGNKGEALAFEEMCALLRLGRNGKYNGSYEQIAQVIRSIPCQNVTQTMETFFRMVLLAMATRNGDAHLKNFGVLYDTTGAVHLAPAYDLVTTTVYLAKDHPALELGGRKLWASKEQLFDFGTGPCDLRPAVVRRSLEAVRVGLVDTAKDLERFGSENPEFNELSQGMRRQWQLGLQGL